MKQLFKKLSSVRNSKVFKAIGVLLVLASFFFIGRSIYNSWDSLVESINKRSIHLSALLSVMVAAMLWVFAALYKSLLGAMTDSKIDEGCISLYIRSTLYKYLPGNVMHFVGRNALVKEGEVSFAQVNAASVYEVLVNLVASFIVAVSFSGKLVFIFLRDHLDYRWFWVVIAAAVLLAIVALLFFRRLIIALFHQALNKRVIRILLLMLLIYTAWNIIGNSIGFLILRSFELEMPSSAYRIVIGAGTGAWFIGFITPGAPGGIGVREAAMGFLISGVVPMWAISACGIITRIAQILGEVLANAALVLLRFIRRRGSSEKTEGKIPDE